MSVHKQYYGQLFKIKQMFMNIKEMFRDNNLVRYWKQKECSWPLL